MRTYNGDITPQRAKRLLLQTQGVISRRVRHRPLARRAEHRLRARAGSSPDAPHRHRHQKDAFGGPLEGFDPAERDYAERYWRQMITDGQIDRFDNREEQERQQEGEVRPQQGEAQRLQAAGPRAVRQHHRLPALLRDTGGQHLGPEVAARDGQAAVGEGREIYWKLGYKEAPFRKMKICRSQRSPD